MSATEVTAGQVRGRWATYQIRAVATGTDQDGNAAIVVIFDSGYDLTRLAWLLADLPVEVLGELRSDRVMYFPPRRRRPGTQRPPVPARRRAQARRPANLARPGGGYGHRDNPLRRRGRHGLEPRAPAAGQPRQIRGPRRTAHMESRTIRLAVDHLPGDRSPDPLWLWETALVVHSANAVDRTWQAFLRTL